MQGAIRLNRKFRRIDIARIVIGLCLIALGGYFVFNAIETNVIVSRGNSYSLEEHPISFFFVFGIYVCAVIGGIGAIISGLRRRD